MKSILKQSTAGVNAKPSGKSTLLSFVIASLFLTACSVAKRDHYELPTVSLAENYTNKPEAVRVAKPNETVPAARVEMGYTLDSILTEWWRIWGSDELNMLIDRALANNHNLKIATWRIAQLQARTHQAAAGKYPAISLPIGINSQTPALGPGTVAQGDPVTQRDIFQMSLRLDWRPDIWGEAASAQQSAELTLWRATFARDDVQRQLITEVATNYIEYLSLNDRLRVARDTELELNRIVEAVRTRMQKGDATIIELEQQKTAVFQVSSTIPVLEQQRALILNRLSELMGDTSSALKLSSDGLDGIKIPAMMPGVPSSLLLRRPDVRAAEARLLAADADIDLARTRVLPPLDLSSQVGYGSRYMSQLFEPHTLFWNAVANLSITLFDSGKRRQEVKFAKAVYEEMVETYLQVVFGAVREVDDSLVSIRQTEKQLEKKQIATTSAERAWKYSMESFMIGGVDYITLLDTERTYHKNLDELYDVKMSRYKSMVALLGSLGGGISREGIDDKFGWRPVHAAAVDEGMLLMASQPSGVGNFVNEQADQKVAVLHPAPESSSLVRPLDEAYDKLRQVTNGYLVELSGIYDRNTLASAGRDLVKRMPELFAGIELLPLQQGRVKDGDGERAAWYRLFAYQFADKEKAEGFCTSLRLQQQRCRVMSARSVAELDEVESYEASDIHHQMPELIATPPSVALSRPASAMSSEDSRAQCLALSSSAVCEAARKSNRVMASEQVVSASNSSLSTQEDVSASTYGYEVQLGSFDRADGAQMQEKHWRDLGYDVRSGMYQDSRGKQWYVVRMGKYKNQLDARHAAQSFANKEQVPAIIVQQPLDRIND